MSAKKTPAPALRNPHPGAPSVDDWVRKGPASLEHLDPSEKPRRTVTFAGGKTAARRTIYLTPATDELLERFCRSGRKLSAVVDAAVVAYIKDGGHT